MPVLSDALSLRPMGDAAEQPLIERAKRGDFAAFEQIMRAHNQRLYRAIRSMLRNDAEVEDVMQDAYFAAFTHLAQFEGRAKFSTWLLRIGINEAMARSRRSGRLVSLEDLPADRSAMTESVGPTRSPEEQAAGHEMVTIVEAALDRLPDDYRQVFVLRVVESLDTAETADLLGMSEAAVKQRLHRARALLQDEIEIRTGTAIRAAFGFLGPRCDRVVANVIRRLTNPR